MQMANDNNNNAAGIGVTDTFHTPSHTPDIPRQRSTPRKPESCCDCPSCDGPECLCRPRFFAGQLLTEQDLNQLDRYITGKNKLHNRYVHGWGTVCGLEVSCNPCGEGVRVSSGYAIDPCGNDIIVCEPDEVDVCDLIKRCRPKRDPSCDPPRARRAKPCPEANENWILALEYVEQPSRQSPLMHRKHEHGACGCGCSGKRDCGCGCGGSGSCGCGNGTKSRKTRVGPPPVQCEPTLVCETYRYVVYPAPPKKRDDNTFGFGGDREPGRMAERFNACLSEFIEALAPEPETDSTDQMHDWICRTKHRLWQFFAKHPPAMCDWKCRLESICCPEPGDENFEAAAEAAKLQFSLLFMDYMVHCLCSAILPPCPETPCRNIVPLAQVTVATDGCACTVTRVCNWTTERRIVRTFDNFAYWLEPLNIVRMIREALDAMCCDLFGLRDKYQRVIDRLDPCGRKPQPNDPNDTSAAAANVNHLDNAAMNMNTEAGAQPMYEELHAAKMKSVPKDFYRFEQADRAKAIGGVGLEALFAKKSLLNPVQLFNGVLGGKDADGNAYLKDEERQNLMTYLGANYLAAPAVRQSMPGALSGAFEMIGGLLSGLGGDASGFDMAQMFGGASASKASPSPASSASEASAEELKAMKAELAEMRKTVEMQQKEIKNIKKSKG